MELGSNGLIIALGPFGTLFEQAYSYQSSNSDNQTD